MQVDRQERAQLINQYRDGYRVVTESLAGVTDEELDRSATGDWTPRQIAHHLADSEMMSAIRIRRLLAEAEPDIYGYDEKAFAERSLLLDDNRLLFTRTMKRYLESQQDRL